MLWTKSKNWSRFQKFKFLCFTESRNNHCILLLLCCWYMAYIRKCLPENYWGLCTCAQNSARTEQGSKLLSLQTLRSGWMSAEIWGDFRSAKIHRDAVSLLCDSLMVSSPTQQVADSWICFNPGLRTQEISFSPLKKIIGSIEKRWILKGNWVDMQTKI